MSLTNAELNAWYEEKVLKKCVFIKNWKHASSCQQPIGTHPYHLIFKCPKCDVEKHSSAALAAEHRFPDHLSDPAVILGIWKELLKRGVDIDYDEERELFEAYMPVDDSNKWLLTDESLKRAVMLALKAKEEG